MATSPVPISPSQIFLLSTLIIKLSSQPLNIESILIYTALIVIYDKVFAFMH